jgi:ABC-type dipeptide/oligopeptide/nickel transport system ATPase component
MAVMLITHDLGVVADTAARVVVMYAGRCGRRGAGPRPVLKSRYTHTRRAIGVDSPN